MDLEPIYLPIRKVDNVRHAYLGLEGTILLFDQRQAAIDSEMLIPVELVTMSDGSRYNGRRLIAALLSLLLPVLAFALCCALVFGVRPAQEIESTPTFALLGALFAGVFLAGLIACLILLVAFFFRVPTVRLRIEPTGALIEFYKPRRRAGPIDDFLEQMRRRQALVAESPAGLVRRPAGFTKEHSIVPRLAALLWLASLPALLTALVPLLVLPVAVLAWFGYRQIRYLGQPREYRQAVRRYLRGDYDDAIDLLETLRGRIPEYLPTYFCLAEACTRGGRFDEALAATSCLANDYPDVARNMEADIWLFRRIDERRQPTA